MGRNSRLALAVFATIICSSANASSIEPPYSTIRMRAGERVQLDEIIDYRGEVIFYTSDHSRKLRLVFPYCVSGITELDAWQVSIFIGHKVRIEAKVADVKPNIQPDSLSTWSLVEGVPIKNWCFGGRALIITHIERQE